MLAAAQAQADAEAARRERESRKRRDEGNKKREEEEGGIRCQQQECQKGNTETRELPKETNISRRRKSFSPDPCKLLKDEKKKSVIDTDKFELKPFSEIDFLQKVTTT